MDGVKFQPFFWGFQLTLSPEAVLALVAGSTVVATAVTGVLAANATAPAAVVIGAAISARIAAYQIVAGTGYLTLSSPWPMPLVLFPWPGKSPQHNSVLYANFKTGQWSPVGRIPGDHITNIRPTFAPYQNDLFMFHRSKAGEENIAYTKYTPNGGWGENIKIPACQSKFDVAAIEYKKDLHVVHRGGGSDTSLWHIKQSGGIWGKDIEMANMNTIAGPAIAKFSGYLHVVALGTDGFLWTTTGTGTRWGAYTKIANANATSGPALVLYNDFLYCIVRGRDSTLWWMYHDGVSWGPYKQIRGGFAFSTGAPALCIYNENLVCAVRGNDGNLWFTIYDGRKWSDFQSAHMKMGGDPALVNFQSKVAITSKGREVMCAFQSE